ncbi:MAG: hypothetical protein MK538_01260 [Planctomycetes bacterium]|nr:hypothetical protein [Planctomycetota bacterium]
MFEQRSGGLFTDDGSQWNLYQGVPRLRVAIDVWMAFSAFSIATSISWVADQLLLICCAGLFSTVCFRAKLWIHLT